MTAGQAAGTCRWASLASWSVTLCAETAQGRALKERCQGSSLSGEHPTEPREPLSLPPTPAQAVCQVPGKGVAAPPGAGPGLFWVRWSWGWIPALTLTG